MDGAVGRLFAVSRAVAAVRRDVVVTGADLTVVNAHLVQRLAHLAGVTGELFAHRLDVVAARDDADADDRAVGLGLYLSGGSDGDRIAHLLLLDRLLCLRRRAAGRERCGSTRRRHESGDDGHACECDS